VLISDKFKNVQHNLLLNFIASVLFVGDDASRCECFDLHRQLIPYAEAYCWQKSIVERRKGLIDTREDHSDTLIALQHPPVYTLGTDSKKEYLHFDKEDAPFEIHHTNRGGEVTYHGPGQVFISYVLVVACLEVYFIVHTLVVCLLISCFLIVVAV